MSSQELLRVTKLSAVTDQQLEPSTNAGHPMPSNGLEFYYVLDKRGHRNSSELISERGHKLYGVPLHTSGRYLCFINTSFEMVQMKQILTNTLQN